MIKVNIITGYVGSGKTTAIQNLLEKKPIAEKWVVFVNQFRKINFDYALLTHVKIIKTDTEVIACVSEWLNNLDLNKLIVQIQPIRVLIELAGHESPEQILALFNTPKYYNLFDLRAVLCLLDARQLNKALNITNENFCKQIATADIIIWNKSDRYQQSDYQLLINWQYTDSKLRPRIVTSQGKLALPVLDLVTTPYISNDLFSSAPFY